MSSQAQKGRRGNLPNAESITVCVIKNHKCVADPVLRSSACPSFSSRYRLLAQDILGGPRYVTAVSGRHSCGTILEMSRENRSGAGRPRRCTAVVKRIRDICSLVAGRMSVKTVFA